MLTFFRTLYTMIIRICLHPEEQDHSQIQDQSYIKILSDPLALKLEPSLYSLNS